MESKAMSFAKARSSAVIPTSGGGPVTVKRGLARDEARDTRRRAPFRRPKRFRALATAKLHQTIDKHSMVPAKSIGKIAYIIHCGLK